MCGGAPGEGAGAGLPEAYADTVRAVVASVPDAMDSEWGGRPIERGS